MTACHQWIRSLLGLAVLTLLFAGGGLFSIGCSSGCETLAPSYQLSSDCLVEGAAQTGTCTVQQNECVVVLKCGDTLPYCRGFMIGKEINFSCTLSDLRNSQVLADPTEQGYQLLVLQKNSCKVQLKK